MTQTYYRKYRSALFSEIEGQEHVVRTLSGALLSGNVGHAYLFSGPRGVGKTSIARIFAKALNCQNRKSGQFEPCNQCSSCLAINNGNSLDLIEIDAASNRGIDDIRDLKESARVAAASSTYKVYIIDEVHMLTKDAFNALLKTLEEPASHVVFILATTEPHKILETVLSRVQRFDLKKITHDQIVHQLKKIALAEKIEIEPEALSALANYSTGSLRDALSALAKLVSYAGAKISVAHTAEILGIVPASVHAELLTALAANQTQPILRQIEALHNQGVDLDNFVKQFIIYTRGQLIAMTASTSPVGNISAEKMIKIINAFIKARTELKNSPIPQLPLELAVMELTANGKI